MNPEDLDLATDYLNGQLDAAGAAAVEERLAADVDFAALVARLRGLRSAMLAEERAHAQAAIADAVAEADESLFEARPSRRPLWRVAAAVALLGVVGALVWYFGLRSETDLKALFEAEFEVMPNMESSLGGAVSAGFDAYDAREWGAARTAFDAVPEADPDFDRVQVYRGITCLSLGDAEAAIAVLSPYVNERCPDPSCPVYHYESVWYLALAHLLNGDAAAARPLLERLSADAGAYRHAAAQRVLKALE